MRLILCAEGPVEPNSALRQYLAMCPPSEGNPIHLVFGMRRTPPPGLAHVKPFLTVRTFLPGRGLRGVEGVVYDRRSYSEICRALVLGTFSPSVVIACATPPDESGMRTLGAVNGYLELALAIADQIVIEQVDWLPRVPGAALVPRADLVIPTEHHQGEQQPGFASSPEALDFAIADNVASLIPRDAQLALGIGRVNDAVGQRVMERNDVGIVTGVVTDGLRRMAEARATSAPIEAMSVVGSEELLRWSEQDGTVELRPSTEIHEPTWLAAHDRFVAVLGALQVDHLGNVNAERAGTVLVSGKGGAPDFAKGAHDSAGGRSIVALSANHSADKPRLVPLIDSPTIPAEWIDAVVTEHGVAVLENLDVESRARVLRAIF